MFTHPNHSRPDEIPNAVVIDLFAEKRIRLGRKFGALHPALRAKEAQIELAAVIPLRGARRPRMTS